MTVGIIDYGCGNLFSLKSSFARIGSDSVVTSDKAELYKCDKVVLPGVGAFSEAMLKLKAVGLDRTVKELSRGTPLLGICLGMQLLFDRSFEFGECDGLGLIGGEVVRLDVAALGLKTPQMGWNGLKIEKDCPLFKYTRAGEHVYFVHSYHAVNCADSVVATVDHGGAVTAAVARGHVFGAQFHPEKSGEVGLNILRAFTEI
ncbi:MAG: imidazole glycerol phosphate synthase subunit HisH [Clostridiales bacterium]|nr:imidazole glycerol phosphate synthase subunit HisH [Clostridiales bacterium]